MTLAGVQTVAGVQQPPTQSSLDDFVCASAALAVLIPLYGLAVGVVLGLDPGSRQVLADVHFVSGIRVFPEPREQQSYLLLLTAPLAVAALTVGLRRLAASRQSRRRTLIFAAAAGQCQLVVLIVCSAVGQLYIDRYFSALGVASGLIAAAVTALAILDTRFLSGLTHLARRLGRNGHIPTYLASMVAGFATLAVTVGLYNDRNFGFAPAQTWYHVPFTSEEYAAVTNGATPLVDFTPQYNFVLPYVMSPLFKLLGGVTTESFTWLMTIFSWLAFMAVFVALSMICKRPILVALGYLAFLAISLFPAFVDGDQIHSAVTYYAIIPMRYGLPLLLAPLIVQVAKRPKPAFSIALTVAAAATLLNNVDFGVPAFGGVVVSRWCAARMQGTSPWREFLHLAMATAAFIVLIMALARVRTGSWPEFTEMFYFPRQFALAGLGMIPMPGPFGLHLIMFMTFVGGLTLSLLVAGRGVSRGANAHERRAAVALLAYASTLGLGAGTYYVGRSDSRVLVALFGLWGLALVALALVLSPLAAGLVNWPRHQRVLLLPTVGTLAACLVLSLSTWSLQTPALHLVSRYERSGIPLYKDRSMGSFVHDCSPTRADVMLIYPLGYRIARSEGVRNHFPYASPLDLITYEQIDRVVQILDDDSISMVFTSQRYLAAPLGRRLRHAGWHIVVQRDAGDEFALWERLAHTADARPGPLCPK